MNLFMECRHRQILLRFLCFYIYLFLFGRCISRDGTSKCFFANEISYFSVFKHLKDFLSLTVGLVVRTILTTFQFLADWHLALWSIYSCWYNHKNTFSVMIFFLVRRTILQKTFRFLSLMNKKQVWEKSIWFGCKFR